LRLHRSPAWRTADLVVETPNELDGMDLANALVQEQAGSMALTHLRNGMSCTCGIGMPTDFEHHRNTHVSECCRACNLQAIYSRSTTRFKTPRVPLLPLTISRPAGHVSLNICTLVGQLQQYGILISNQLSNNDPAPTGLIDSPLPEGLNTAFIACLNATIRSLSRLSRPKQVADIVGAP
jgi:hypothetical protein